MSTPLLNPPHSTPELIGVGDGGWIACDARVAPGDPHRIIAYLECKDGQVYVLPVREHHDVCCFDTLERALDAMTEIANRSARERITTA